MSVIYLNENASLFCCIAVATVRVITQTTAVHYNAVTKASLRAVSNPCAYRPAVLTVYDLCKQIGTRNNAEWALFARVDVHERNPINHSEAVLPGHR
jgi:hypothetical protein